MSSTCEARAPARHHADLLLLEALPPSEEPQPRSAQFRIRRYIPVRGEIRILKNALTGALALRNVCLYVQWAWRRVRGGCERTHLDQQHYTALVPSMHARIGSTSSITGRASTSPIRARPIINAIGAACRHASLHSGAPALSSVHCGQTMHRLSWRQHASPIGQAARSRPLAASTEQPG